jgi:GNAT superfamily N-acetyltransferase
LNRAIDIRRLKPAEISGYIEHLSSVLIDCVEGGASVSFMAPLTRKRADAFWRGVQDRVATGTSELLVAHLDAALVGTVQIVMPSAENQAHRADVAKMLVHRKARRLGVGRALMTAVENVARSLGKTLLVLDTVTGSDAERFYKSLNWTVVGRIPGYALFPDGRPCDTTYFYKKLSTPSLVTDKAVIS